MRPSQIRPVLVSLLFSNLVVAHPYPHDELKDAGFGYLMLRDCASYCGADNQYCCSAGETCTTAAGIASCAAGVGAGGAYTTTWTETRTYTSTISSYVGPTTAASGGQNGEPCTPPEGSGQIACGPICCASYQYCAYEGQCLPNVSAGSGSWTQWTTVGVITTQYSAPYRVTSGSTIVQTSAQTTGTAASETTTSTSTPTPVASTGGGLSGGAIAGIVIGTIAGVALLLLLCFCCIVRGLWGVFAGLFGGGRKKRDTERIEVIEEHYSRRGSRHGSAYGASAAAARPTHRTWFGGGGGRPASAAPRKEKKGSGLGWLAAGLGGAALLLGLRRDDKRRSSSHKPPRSEIGSSYYTDSYTASDPSSRSSRRSRDTRRSRQSRGTRASRTSRRPSRV